jgi:hypothetical protein
LGTSALVAPAGIALAASLVVALSDGPEFDEVDED